MVLFLHPGLCPGDSPLLLTVIKVGMQKWEYRSGNTKVGIQKWEYKSGNTEVGIQKWEYKSGNTKVGIQKWEYKSGNTEVGIQMLFEYNFENIAHTVSRTATLCFRY